MHGLFKPPPPLPDAPPSQKQKQKTNKTNHKQKHKQTILKLTHIYQLKAFVFSIPTPAYREIK